jgi:energy-converting hydrogenase B subunit D
MTLMASALMLLIAASGLVVVCTRDVTKQVLALSFYGIVMALAFFFFQAPDVALSQVVVGAVALPLMIMLALSRMKFRQKISEQEAKEHE